jgi:Raf kinase inhibitor-like YbhB/YbcL family protein
MALLLNPPFKTIMELTISSPVFSEDGLIPTKYTADGQKVNPPLVIDNIPDGTISMALIMEDPDAPKGTVTHWVLWDINPVGSIGENTDPGVSGVNTMGKIGYLPPNPPSGKHRYYFHVFALDSSLDLRPGSDRSALETDMKDHILASGRLMGRYGKNAVHQEKAN